MPGESARFAQPLASPRDAVVHAGSYVRVVRGVVHNAMGARRENRAAWAALDCEWT
jgi:hypothetical protein